MVGRSMTLINPSLIATASSVQTASVPRKADPQAYAAAMRDAGATAKTGAAANDAQPARAVISREAPFGAERPRYQRPGSLLDIRV